MSSNATTIEIPASLYTRLQSLASKQKTDPAHVVERLINASSEPADAIVRDPALRGGQPQPAANEDEHFCAHGCCSRKYGILNNDPIQTVFETL